MILIVIAGLVMVADLVAFFIFWRKWITPTNRRDRTKSSTEN